MSRVSNTESTFWGNPPNKSIMTEEEELREKHPGLKDLWEKYQTMLKLVKESEPKQESASDILELIRQRQRGKSIGVKSYKSKNYLIDNKILDGVLSSSWNRKNNK